ncbi:MAG: multidrug efflux SMR transporter [Mucispirillum sp.]|nr:multidrug efflux SMR transporter [Mucispirillum sp.]
MSWVYLIIAGIFEVGWPLGFKLASTYTKYSVVFIGVSVISMTLSGVFLYIAQKTIPIGTAYVIWTGVGAVGTLLIGIFFFGDSANFWRLFFITMIIIGVIGTKIVH